MLWIPRRWAQVLISVFVPGDHPTFTFGFGLSLWQPSFIPSLFVLVPCLFTSPSLLKWTQNLIAFSFSQPGLWGWTSLCPVPTSQSKWAFEALMDTFPTLSFFKKQDMLSLAHADCGDRKSLCGGSGGLFVAVIFLFCLQKGRLLLIISHRQECVHFSKINKR